MLAKKRNSPRRASYVTRLFAGFSSVGMKPVGQFICLALLFCGEVRPSMGAQGEAVGANHESLRAEIGTAQSRMLKPCFEAQTQEISEQRERKAVAELTQYYRAWLTEDVTYIITPEERCAYLKLKTNKEREQFIEQFWNQRNSDLESEDNPFKQEHYRRIVFANEKFDTDNPGWQTDRGRFYIQFGPPDVIESHPVEAAEQWHYRFVDALGKTLDVQFVDPGGTGNYRLQMVPAEKDALLRATPRVPGTFMANAAVLAAQNQIFIYIGPMPVPQVKFKDLEAIVVSQIIRDQVHFSHRIRYTKATHASTMTRILIDIPVDQLTPAKAGDKSTGEFEIFGRISKRFGRVVSTFERSGHAEDQKQVDLPDPNLEDTVALGPGTYRLSLVVKDVISGKVGAVSTSIRVP